MIGALGRLERKNAMSSLAAQLDSATLNEPNASPSAMKPPPSSKPVDSTPKVVLPSSSELGIGRQKPAPTKPLLEPKAWGGVAALARDDESEPSLFARTGSSPPVKAAAKEAPKPAGAPAPAILPAHELARSARASKEQVPVKLEAQQWSGVSSYSEHAFEMQAGGASPEAPRRASKEAVEAAEKPEAYPVSSIPSSREMGGVRERSASGFASASGLASGARRNSTGSVSTGVTAQWGGVANLSDDNFAPKFEESPPAKRVDESPKGGAPAVHIPSSLEMYGNSRTLNGNAPKAANKSAPPPVSGGRNSQRRNSASHLYSIS